MRLHFPSALLLLSEVLAGETSTTSDPIRSLSVGRSAGLAGYIRDETAEDLGRTVPAITQAS